MTKKNEYDPAPHELICFLLGIITVALVTKPLAGTGLAMWWWGFFMICNLVYLVYGMKRGWAKGPTPLMDYDRCRTNSILFMDLSTCLEKIREEDQ